MQEMQAALKKLQVTDKPRPDTFSNFFILHCTDSLPSMAKSSKRNSFWCFFCYTGLGQKVGPRLRECCRKGHAEVKSSSNNKILQTWPFSWTLYVDMGISCTTAWKKAIFLFRKKCPFEIALPRRYIDGICFLYRWNWSQPRLKVDKNLSGG